MPLHIQKIEIRNFRSIQRLSIRPNRMAILVGKNDTGKSNVLRALDLFFNGKTILDSRDFNTNYNKFSVPGKKKAKIIQIRIEIPLPKSYVQKNGDYIVWSKSWQNGISLKEKIVGKNYRGKGKLFQKNIAITPTSNVHQLLNNIKYMYVPAIKDIRYFSQLRADIYESISSDAGDSNFIESSQEFQKAISNQVEALVDQIDKSLSIESDLTLPNDLSHIFRSLDFLGRESKISLNYRGDGVKARHIPIILKFISDRIRESKNRRPYPEFIWGYEEPENSLEMSNCAKLADQLYGYLGSGISQIFLTTHSPVIYDMHRDDSTSDSNISRHQLYQISQNEGTKNIGTTDNLDEHMGVTAFIAPRIRSHLDEIKRMEVALADAENNNLFGKNTVFVEGITDKLVYERAFSVFAPSYVDKVRFMTKKSGGGRNYVIDMIEFWRSRSRHPHGLKRAVGILDRDFDGSKNGKGWRTSSNQNAKWAKFIILDIPIHLVPVRSAGFNIPIDLESHYDKKAWENAKRYKYLERRDLHKIVSNELNRDVWNEKTDKEEILHNDWRIYAEYKFKCDKKLNAAKFFSNREKFSDDAFRQRLSCLEKIVNDVVDYLFGA